MQVQTREAVGLRGLANGHTPERVALPPLIHEFTTRTRVERPPREEGQERRNWRVRAVEKTILVALVVIEIAWLMVLGYAAHRLFLQSLLEY